MSGDVRPPLKRLWTVRGTPKKLTSMGDLSPCPVQSLRFLNYDLFVESSYPPTHIYGTEGTGNPSH